LNEPLPQGLQCNLILADGSRWVIAAGDEEAASIVSQLGNAMQLRAMSPSDSLPPAPFGMSRAGAVEPPHHGIARRLLVRVDAHNPEVSRATGHAPVPFEDDGSGVCVLRSFTHSDGLYIQLMELSLIFAHDAQTRGGVLLHGALAEKDGIGVILAAPGGTGKTTASGRLPAPWRSLCDDATLVVRDSQGNYRAHPWPTWSRFLWGESGGAWDVQNAVLLKGVFFLAQTVEDRVERVGPGHAVSLLVECAGQTSQLMARGLSKEETRALNLERFDNLCALARVVPTHVLHISLTGAFWQEIERMLEGGQDTEQLTAGEIAP
jgi:SynChlorMet cassette protein ScmC